MSLLHQKLKLMRVGIKIRRRLPSLKRNIKKQVYLLDRIEQYKKMWQKIATIVNADFSTLDWDIWQLKRGNKTIRLRLHQFPLDNDVTLRLCGRKPLVHKLLTEENIPVPDFTLFRLSDIQPALDFQKKHPHGCVVKPCDGYAGLGITTHITDAGTLQKAAATASMYLDDFMVEDQIAGENYRILIYKGKMLHAVRRTGQSVVGDGSSTIAELLSIDPTASLSSLDQDLSFTLTAQALSLNTVPATGATILVRSVGRNFNGGAELRTIYDQEVTDLVHDSIQKDAERCAKIVQAELAGVDVITTDISKDLRETGGIINEVNTTPGPHHHYDENTEEFPRVALTIIKDLLQ